MNVHPSYDDDKKDNNITGRSTSIPSRTTMFDVIDWDQVADDLLIGENNNGCGGVAVIDLSPLNTTIPKDAFDVGKKAMNYIRNNDNDNNDDADDDCCGDAQRQQQGMSKSSSWRKRDNMIRQIMIPDTADSAHVTGYHPAAQSNSLSIRYNQYREGFVFSDGNQLVLDDFDNMIHSTYGEISNNNNDNNNNNTSFQKKCYEMESFLHTISEYVFNAMERKLQLQHNFFMNHYGPFRSNSQWHMKRYIYPSSETTNRNNNNNNNTTNQIMNDRNNNNKDDDDNNNNNKIKKMTIGTEEDENPLQILLPTHTDPSLISIIIHDRPGIQVGCQGLRYYRRCHGPNQSKKSEEDSNSEHCDTVNNNNNSTNNFISCLDTNNNNNNNNNNASNSKENGIQNKQEKNKNNNGKWIEVPYSGHQIAIVFLGSLMSYITNGQYPATKHCVILQQQEQQQEQKQQQVNRNYGDNNIETYVPQMTTTTTTTTTTKATATTNISLFDDDRLSQKQDEDSLCSIINNMKKLNDQNNSKDNDDDYHPHRMAATLFVRPAPYAQLQLLPTCLILQQQQQQQQQENASASSSSHTKSHNDVITFQQWIARVSRNYKKSKSKK